MYYFKHLYLFFHHTQNTENPFTIFLILLTVILKYSYKYKDAT